MAKYGQKSAMKNGIDLSTKTILLVNTGNIKKRFILQRLKRLGLKIVCLNKEKNSIVSSLHPFFERNRPRKSSQDQSDIRKKISASTLVFWRLTFAVFFTSR